MATESRQEAIPPLRRHPTLYWQDGSLVMHTVRPLAANYSIFLIKTFGVIQTCGTLYKLNRQLLSMKSGFFAGLFDFPRPTDDPPSKAVSLKALEDQKTSGLDGLTDETALALPVSVD
jgi:hypothetical protein